MEIDVKVKSTEGNRVHIVVDRRRYVGVWADQEVILPQNTSLSFHTTMSEALRHMDLDLYPRTRP